MVTNTWFEQENRRYTCKQPGNINRYQLGYILVRQRCRTKTTEEKWTHLKESIVVSVSVRQFRI